MEQVEVITLKVPIIIESVLIVPKPTTATLVIFTESEPSRVEII